MGMPAFPFEHGRSRLYALHGDRRRDFSHAARVEMTIARKASALPLPPPRPRDKGNARRSRGVSPSRVAADESHADLRREVSELSSKSGIPWRKWDTKEIPNALVNLWLRNLSPLPTTKERRVSLGPDAHFTLGLRSACLHLYSHPRPTYLPVPLSLASGFASEACHVLSPVHRHVWSFRAISLSDLTVDNERFVIISWADRAIFSFRPWASGKTSFPL